MKKKQKYNNGADRLSQGLTINVLLYTLTVYMSSCDDISIQATDKKTKIHTCKCKYKRGETVFMKNALHI